MSGRLRKSRSTLGSRGSKRGWWFSPVNFYNFFSIHVFVVEVTISDLSFYWTTMFAWPRKSRSTSGSRGSQWYWWFCLRNFHNFFSIYVFEVKESMADIPTEIPCLGDFKNSRSTSGHTGIHRRYLWLFLVAFYSFFTIHIFESTESIFDIPTELPCSGDLEILGQLPIQEVLVIRFYRFSKFLHYLCFRG